MNADAFFIYDKPQWGQLDNEERVYELELSLNWL